jgi:uncharacterized membrane protein YjgN (DUF898 family)
MIAEKIENSNKIKYKGKVKTLFCIYFKNLILSFVTFNLYRFWAKTKIRKFLLNSCSLNSYKFEYLGTGFELFKLLLKTIAVILFLCVIYVIIFSYGINLVLVNRNIAVAILLIAFAILLVLFLFYLESYTALRYMLSRIRWRGVKCYLKGSSFKFGLIKTGYFFSNLLTLGILIPYTDIKAYKYIIKNTYLNNKAFKFTQVPEKTLFKINIITLILLLPTFGLSRFWYKAAILNYKISHTSFNNLTFKSNFKGFELASLFLGNIVICIFSFGLAYHFVIHRNFIHYTENFIIIGDISGFSDSDEKPLSSG